MKKKYLTACLITVFSFAIGQIQAQPQQGTSKITTEIAEGFIENCSTKLNLKGKTNLTAEEKSLFKVCAINYINSKSTVTGGQQSNCGSDPCINCFIDCALSFFEAPYMAPKQCPTRCANAGCGGTVCTG